MNKFWKWMEKNRYGMYLPNEPYHDGVILARSASNPTAHVFPTKQMLTGYMIEYLGEFPWVSFETIDSYYERLKDEIERRV